MDRNVHFHNCITLSIIHTVLKSVDPAINFYYFTALPIIPTVLKKQACNIYKYWSYNRNLRVLSARTLVLLIMRPWNWEENRYPESWLGLVYHLSSQYWLILVPAWFCSFSVENRKMFSCSPYVFTNYQSRKQKKLVYKYIFRQLWFGIWYL